MSDTTKQVDQRHLARALALQRLFTILVQGQAPFENSDLLEELNAEDVILDEDFVERIVKGVTENLVTLDTTISDYASEWPIAQIAPVDLTILRIAIWEAFVSKVTPAKVVINEAIELAKEFGGENSKSFINGVLGNIYRKKHEEETK